MNRTLPHLSKLLSPWSSASHYQSRVTATAASNDEHFDLRDLPAAPASNSASPARLIRRQSVLLSNAGGEPRYIDGSMLVRRRDS